MMNFKLAVVSLVFVAFCCELAVSKISVLAGPPCVEVTCAFPCQYGYKEDFRGCPTCSCIPVNCSLEPCQCPKDCAYCPKDANGCSTSACYPEIYVCPKASREAPNTVNCLSLGGWVNQPGTCCPLPQCRGLSSSPGGDDNGNNGNNGNHNGQNKNGQGQGPTR